MRKRRPSERVFDAVSTAVIRAPWWIVGGFLALAAFSALFAGLKLEMRTNQDDLISADLAYKQRYDKFIQEFGDLEFLFVVILVDGKPDLAMQVADVVAEELSKLTEHVQEVFHRLPPESFGESGLLLLPRQEIEELVKSVTDNAETLKRFQGADSFARFLLAFSEAFSPSMAARNPKFAEWGFKLVDLSLESLVLAARGDDPPALQESIEGITTSSDADPRSKGYLFSENGELAFVEIMPKKNYETLEVIEKPLEEIRKALDRVREHFPGVRFGLTGRPVLQADEMRTTNQDMTLSTVVAFVFVLALFTLVFRRLRRPFLACSSLGVGIAITFGVVTATIGHLNLLSVVFTVMLVGLADDFGIQFLARYQDELLETDDIEGSIRRTLLSTGRGIWTGGVTTAAAFYSTLFVHFSGLAELGFIAGTGLLICLVTMLAFLPALILITDRHIRRHRVLHPPHLVRIPLLGHASRHPKTTLAILALITAAGLYRFQGVPYNWNLLDLQARGLESVEYELTIIEKSDRSTWWAAFIVDSLDAVDRTIEALRPAQEAGIVGSMDSIRQLVPTDQAEKLAILKPAREVVASVSFPPPLAAVAKEQITSALQGLLQNFRQLHRLAGFRDGKESAEAAAALDGLIRKVETLRDLLDENPAPVLERLSAYQAQWFGELQALRGKVLKLLEPPMIVPQMLPPAILRRFLSDDGRKFLVNAYPAKDIWEEDNMKEFVAAIRKVDPDVTGVPIQVYESERLMRKGFLLAGLYSLIMVSVLIFIDFRSLKDTCLALVPIGVGLLWAFQLMPLFGLDFNLANFFSLPILVGYGVEGGVHVIHRFHEVGSTADVGKTTGSAIALSLLTTIVGFSAMSLARHRGVASLGIVTALGCITVLIATVVLLPSLIEVVEALRRRRAGRE